MHTKTHNTHGANVTHGNVYTTTDPSTHPVGHGQLGSTHNGHHHAPVATTHQQVQPVTQNNNANVKPSKIGGKMTSAKGDFKEKMGRMFNKPELVASGIQDQLRGEAKESTARYNSTLQ